MEYDDYTDILAALRRGSLDPRGVAGLIDDAFALISMPGSAPALTLTVALDLLKTALEATADYTGGYGSRSVRK